MTIVPPESGGLVVSDFRGKRTGVSRWEPVVDQVQRWADGSLLGDGLALMARAVL